MLYLIQQISCQISHFWIYFLIHGQIWRLNQSSLSCLISHNCQHKADESSVLLDIGYEKCIFLLLLSKERSLCQVYQIDDGTKWYKKFKYFSDNLLSCINVWGKGLKIEKSKHDCFERGLGSTRVNDKICFIWIPRSSCSFLLSSKTS